MAIRDFFVRVVPGGRPRSCDTPPLLRVGLIGGWYIGGELVWYPGTILYQLVIGGLEGGFSLSLSGGAGS